ncbi:steroid receptor-associated and regulated protein [Balaenoptera musculus]|uniref:Steroid receptor-associated and regulated protein n=2 Tax=Balaenoptera TaxID=9766 RepID=A0A8B8VD77_BALMU|nr:steroid receptor-associated and regulated protein [Balaenoptera musculus]
MDIFNPVDITPLIKAIPQLLQASSCGSWWNSLSGSGAGKYKTSGPRVGAASWKRLLTTAASASAEPGAMESVAVPTEDPRDLRACPQVRGLETDLETSSGGKPARHRKAIPKAHLTFVIDCTHGKQISLAALPGPPRVPSPNLGPVIPPMKTYILLCGENRPRHVTQEAPLGGGGLAQTRGPLPPCRETTAPASSPASPLCLQGAPEAKGGPVKTVSSRSSAWGTVIVSLKALSSCVCGQAD